MITRKQLILVLTAILAAFGPLAQDAQAMSRADRLNKRADRAFIRGDYTKAMTLYEQAEESLQGETVVTREGLEQQLRIARLYILLLQPEKAIHYYDAVHTADAVMLTVNDVCFFVDALRQLGLNQKAEIVARRYAFLSPFSRNQRYINILHSLSNQQYYYAVGESDYGVKRVERNSTLPEYWIGEWKGNMFYAVSRSRIQDPLKIYYHQTQYLEFDDRNTDMDLFKLIPRALQSGPVAFSQDGAMMVATGLSYRNMGRISEIGGDEGLFVNQLYYSRIETGGSRWSQFVPLFEHQEGFNYAHPTFFNDDKSLMFASDREGGYGGMDIYIAHWDEGSGKWGEPVNMGRMVNTEGDEIYPRVADDALYFSSNGLEGYGGYDNYRVSFGHNLVLPGSMFHFPYPINTAYNDFGVFFGSEAAYFISDRAGTGTKDDIYTFSKTNSALNSSRIVGVSDEYSAMAGNLSLITGLKEINTETFEKELLVTPAYEVSERDGNVLVSLYFDFNQATLTDESVETLTALLDGYSAEYLSGLTVVGYADDLGSKVYNQRLSERRAESVARYLTRHDVTGLKVEGRGQISLTEKELEQAVQNDLHRSEWVTVESRNLANALSLEDRILINRKLRRVDVLIPGRK